MFHAISCLLGMMSALAWAVKR